MHLSDTLCWVLPRERSGRHKAKQSTRRVKGSRHGISKSTNSEHGQLERRAANVVDYLYLVEKVEEQRLLLLIQHTQTRRKVTLLATPCC